MFTNKFKVFSCWMVLLLFSLNLSASEFTDFDFLSDTEKTEEAKCDCDIMAEYFAIKFKDRCTAQFFFDDIFEPCIEKAEWTVNGVVYSNDLNPKPYEFCGSGKREICLTLVLVTGEECRFCKTVEVECPDCCSCEKLASQIIQTPSDPCALDLELNPDWKDCVESIRWVIGASVFPGTLDPPAVSFTDPGPHTACVKVAFTNGEACEVCKDYVLEGCSADCTCEDIEKGISIAKPDGCSLDFKLDPDLEKCVRRIGWFVDGVFVSSDFTPATYVFPGSGSYELCLVVVLANGKECKFCFKIEVECDDCNCDKIKDGIKVDRPTKCSIDLELDPDLKPCIEKIEWTVNGVVISNDLNPAIYNFPATGSYEICLRVLLITGEECEICWKVDADCPQSECNCDRIKDGIKVDRPTKCSIDLELDSALKECIEKIEWTVDGVVISNSLNPAVYTFPASGSYEICLNVVLVTGEECKICWKVDAFCPQSDCNCDRIKDGIKSDRPTKCSIDLELDPALKECIEKIEWTVNGVVISNDLDPAVYNFPATGTYEICLNVVLITGEECKICWKVDADCPQSECNCEQIKDGIKVDRPSKCSIDLELDPALKPCIEKIEWTVNGVVISNDLNPGVYTFPSSGTYEICLRVLLTTGEECKFCWKVDAECPCDCEAIKNSINFNQDDPCKVDFWLDDAQKECVEALKWVVNGVGYSGDFNPPALPLFGSGVVEICLYTILTTGEECEFCYKIEYDCPRGKQTMPQLATTELPDAFSVYPNPTNGVFTIEMEHTGDATISVSDLSGKLLLTKEVKGVDTFLKEQLDISEYAQGIYMISVDLGDRVITHKLNVQE